MSSGVEKEDMRREFRAFRQMVDGFALHEIIFDDAGRPVDYRFLEVNSAFERLMGLPAGEVRGKTARELLREADPELIENYGRIARTGEPAHLAHYSESLKRHYRVSAFRPCEGCVACVFLDITDQQRTEEILRVSEARIRSIFLAAPVGIGLVVDRVLKEVNERLCEMLGYSAEELQGNGARMLYPTQEDFDYVGKEKYDQIKERGTGTVETRWIRKDGRIINVILSSTPLDPDDWSVGVTFTALDITDRLKGEEDRRKLEAQVQHAQKLESLGVLAGGIAHDFNNLLTTVLGNVDLTLMDLTSASPVLPYLKDIETAARQAAGLCQQMLAYSGKGRFVIEALDLNDVVNEMTHMLRVSVSKKVIIKYDLSPRLPPVEADASQMRQILMNLITNASEAIGEKSGVISIASGAMECDREYLMDTYLDEGASAGPYVYLEVSDTGQGMDEETRTRLFDPFFTTKFTGRGLGMAAVLGIVRGHSGAIKIYSEPGRGTTIKILIPASDNKAKQASVEGRRSEEAWQGTGTVLVADDEDTVRALAKRMLEKAGFSVLLARDGREALDIFRSRLDEIDCVLLDMTMPHLDGEETFRELRRIRHNVRVILSSGYNEQHVTQRFAGKGLAGFVQKPYEYATLTKMLKRVLEG